MRGRTEQKRQRSAELLVTIGQGSYIKPKRLTLGGWLEDWINSYVTTNCSPRTVDSYRSEIRGHIVPALGAIPLTNLRPQHLQSYYARALLQGRVDGKGGLSARTVQYHHRILSEALSPAVKMGLLGRNVAEAVDPPRPKRKSLATLTPEDVPRFLEAARDMPYYLLFYTALYTGMRLGELLGLRWCDVDLDICSLSVVQALYKRRGICQMKEPKSSHSRRQIALSSSLVVLLRKYRIEEQAQRILLGKSLDDGDLVFCHPDGSPLDPGTVTHTFVRVITKAGLPHIRFHDLRHTHATLMLKQGIHPKIVSERLGRASIAITLDTYSHVLPGLQEAAAERFDMLLQSRQTELEDVGKGWGV